MHMTGYREILRIGGWARPLAGSLVGRIPESMISVVLVLLVHQSTGSYGFAGLAAACFGLSTALGGPLAGRALDRFGQRLVLVSLALAFAGTLALLVATARQVPVGVTIALAGLAGLVRPPLESAMRALWAALVPAAHLEAAYVVDAIGQDLVWFGGPLLLSALLLVGEPKTALVACAACTGLGTLAYAATPALPRRRPKGPDGRARERLHSRELSALLAAALLYGVSMGAFEIAITAFSVAHDAKAAVGVLLAIWSVGSILGGLAYGARRWAMPPARRAVALLAAIAVLLGLLALAGSVGSLAALLFVLGLPFAPFTGTLSAAVQARIPAERATEGFTWITAMITTGIALGNAVAGPVTQAHADLGFPFAAIAAGLGAALGWAGARVPARTFDARKRSVLPD